MSEIGLALKAFCETKATEEFACEAHRKAGKRRNEAERRLVELIQGSTAAVGETHYVVVGRTLVISPLNTSAVRLVNLSEGSILRDEVTP